jgi:hypothetical protein
MHFKSLRLSNYLISHISLAGAAAASRGSNTQNIFITAVRGEQSLRLTAIKKATMDNGCSSKPESHSSRQGIYWFYADIWYSKHAHRSPRSALSDFTSTDLPLENPF